MIQASEPHKPPAKIPTSRQHLLGIAALNRLTFPQNEVLVKKKLGSDFVMVLGREGADHPVEAS